MAASVWPGLSSSSVPARTRLFPVAGCSPGPSSIEGDHEALAVAASRFKGQSMVAEVTNARGGAVKPRVAPPKPNQLLVQPVGAPPIGVTTRLAPRRTLTWTKREREISKATTSVSCSEAKE